MSAVFKPRHHIQGQLRLTQLFQTSLGVQTVHNPQVLRVPAFHKIPSITKNVHRNACVHQLLHRPSPERIAHIQVNKGERCHGFFHLLLRHLGKLREKMGLCHFLYRQIRVRQKILYHSMIKGCVLVVNPCNIFIKSRWFAIVSNHRHIIPPKSNRYIRFSGVQFRARKRQKRTVFNFRKKPAHVSLMIFVNADMMIV